MSTSADPPPIGDDPSTILPIEAAEAALRHWWREPLAGLIAVGIGVFDSWHFGPTGGLSSSLDEILVISGIVLIAGSKKLFGAEGTFKGQGTNDATSS